MPVVKVKGGYIVQNTKGKPTTKKKAEARQRAIKASQSKRKK